MQRIMMALLLISSLAQSELMATEQSLVLESGKWSVGGTAALPVFFDSSHTTSVTLEIQPQFGYFIFEGVEISAGVLFKAPLFDSTVDAVDGGYLNWGFNVAGKYFYPIGGNVHLFAGIGAGMSMNRFVSNTLQWNFEFPVGALFAVNDSWAITVGVPVSVNFSIAKPFQGVKIVPGYFGVRAFF